MQGWLSVADASSTYGRGPRTIQKYIKDGHVKGEKFGKTYVVNEESLADFLKGRLKECGECGIEFRAHRSDKVYCTDRCRARHNMRELRKKRREET